MKYVFIDVMGNLDIKEFIDESTNKMSSQDSIENKHTSILKIKDCLAIEYTFSIDSMTNHELENEIKALHPEKGTVKNEIHEKMLTETNENVQCFER